MPTNKIIDKLDIENRRNEIVEELYTTGRINKLYMGRYSDNKQNPLKAYIRQWLFAKGIRENLNQMIQDFYQELFLHVAKMKAEKIVELADNEINNVKGKPKLTSSICLIAKRQLFMNNCEKKKSPNVSYFEKFKYSGVIYNDSTLEIHNEIEENIESLFEKEHSITINDIMSQMSPLELNEFKELANRKLKRGADISKEEKKLDREYFENLETKVFETVQRIKYKIK